MCHLRAIIGREVFTFAAKLGRFIVLACIGKHGQSHHGEKHTDPNDGGPGRFRPMSIVLLLKSRSV